MADKSKPGIGQNFLSLFKSSAPVQEPEMPEGTESVAAFKTPDEIASFLEDNGFESSPNNLQKFLELNSDPTHLDFDFAGLKSSSHPTKVPSIGQVLKDAFLSVPLVAAAKSLVSPLSVVGDGLSRWEGLKTQFISKFPALGAASGFSPEVAQAAVDLSGTGSQSPKLSKTKFPGAKLRMSDSPELGDFLRSMGLPEWVSATGGIVLDIATDAALTGPALVGAKAGSKGIAAKATQILGPEQVTNLTNAYLKFRSNVLVKDVVDTLAGKSKYADLPIEVQKALREQQGEIVWQGATRPSRMGMMLRELLGDDDALKILSNDALHGDVGALGALKTQNKSAWAVISRLRTMQDRTSAQLADYLTDAITANPSAMGKIADDFVPGGAKLPPQVLAETIRNNLGSYVKRTYQMFVDPTFKQTDKTIIQNAVDGLIKDWDMSTDEAADYITNFMERKTIDIRRGAKEFKISQDSFRHRKDIPEYFRKLMGEIDDPVYNAVKSISSTVENASTFKLYKALREQGLFTKNATATNTKQMGQSGVLSLGSLNGMYTTPELHALLNHINEVAAVQDRGWLRLMQGVKGVKTVGNVKTHMHNTLGNLFFSFLDGVSPTTHAGEFKRAFEILASEVRVGQGKTFTALSPEFEELVKHGIIKNEFPHANEVRWLKELLDDPYTLKPHGLAAKTFRDTAAGAARLYAWEDQLFKTASYLYKTRTLGMDPADAAQAVFKWYPNYIEAGKLAERTRNSALGLFFLNPFLTFRTESHRIMLNAFKDGPDTALKASIILGHNAAWNASKMAFLGAGVQDIQEFFLSRPEAVSEVLLAGENADINEQYVNPFNSKGLFAPLLWAAGAEGVNPFDYLLDFTQFSPEFGYSNLLINAVEPLLTGRGQFGQALSFGESLQGVAKAAGPTSLTTDLPKIFDASQPADERIRRAFKFFGLDVEDRNPKWVETQIRSRLAKKIRVGDDTSSLIQALKVLGFDTDRLVKSAISKAASEHSKPITPDTSKDKAIDGALKYFTESRG